MELEVISPKMELSSGQRTPMGEVVKTVPCVVIGGLAGLGAHALGAPPLVSGLAGATAVGLSKGLIEQFIFSIEGEKPTDLAADLIRQIVERL